MPILTDSERVGTTIAGGKYALEGVLGRGGMGTVFEAVHTWTGRRVAIKLLRHDLASNEEASLRYLQEARAATAIDHPNVVEVLDMGRDDDVTVYLVFELLEGESLADLIERKGRLGSDEAARILLPILDALGRAHRLGIIHRDLKPENVFLEIDGNGLTRAKLLDFGIARVENSTTGETRPGVVSGTPEYMSPEHAQGQRVGATSDVWSMGVVLYECLTGQRPFDGENAIAVLMALTTHPIPSLRAFGFVPDPVADVVARCLVRDPTKRLPNGEALRDALASSIGVVCLSSRSRSTPPQIVDPSGELAITASPALSSDSFSLARGSDPPVVIGTIVPSEAPTLDDLPKIPTATTFRTVSIAGAAACLILLGGGLILTRLRARPESRAAVAHATAPAVPTPAPAVVDARPAPTPVAAAAPPSPPPSDTRPVRPSGTVREPRVSVAAPAVEAPAPVRRGSSRAATRDDSARRGANGSLILD